MFAEGRQRAAKPKPETSDRWRGGLAVKVVRARCNNGWMGDLELRMKRLFTQKRAGKVFPEMTDIDLLTRWSIKTRVIW